jgi:restriction endonuclease Mrr
MAPLERNDWDFSAFPDCELRPALKWGIIRESPDVPEIVAREYAAGLHQKIILIDGWRLAALMIEHGLGVSEEHAYNVKKIDSDYFEES